MYDKFRNRMIHKWIMEDGLSFDNAALKFDSLIPMELPKEKVKPLPPTEKTCFKCKEVLPLNMFHKSVNNRDKHGSYCKMCIGVIKREKYALANSK